jgi:hypothetical protein
MKLMKAHDHMRCHTCLHVSQLTLNAPLGCFIMSEYAYSFYIIPPKLSDKEYILMHLHSCVVTSYMCIL